MEIYFAACPCKALGKVHFLSSVNAWYSAKITTISYGRLLTVLCRASSFAEYLTLGKDVFTAMPSVLRLVKVFVTESATLPSVREKALGKVPSARQRAEFR
jgi:hypothetical protein